MEKAANRVDAATVTFGGAEEDAGRMGDLTPEREHPDASVVEGLVAAMNEHDLDRMVALFHPDYESRQPAHPGRSFTGRDQVRENWAAMFGGVPDFRAELRRCVQDGDLSWTEWAGAASARMVSRSRFAA